MSKASLIERLRERGKGFVEKNRPMDRDLPDLFVTLCPSFGHFEEFATNKQLAGIRLNSAMLLPEEVSKELRLISNIVCRSCGGTSWGGGTDHDPRPWCNKCNDAQPGWNGDPENRVLRDDIVPLWFDVKGRQLRVVEALDNPEYLDLRMNHPIKVDTPTVVLLKAGADRGLLGEVLEDGHRLLFSGNPQYRVNPGESIHIRSPSLEIGGPLFSDVELDKINRVRAAGVNRWFLSYVEEQRDLDLFREVVGEDAEVMLKIESKRGLRFVAEEFKKDPYTRLVAACGDLYVEIDQPHHIFNALKLIIAKDPQAVAGSRMLLSVVQEPVPSLADLGQLAWLYEIGYRTYMLCDELCLKGDMLNTAVNVFDAFSTDYR